MVTLGLLSSAELARLGLVMPAGNVVRISSPSGAFRLEFQPSDPLRVQLSGHDAVVAAFRLPFPSPGREFLLDDGTYIAMDRARNCRIGLDQTLVAVASTGAVLWKREARSLVPEAYAAQYLNPRVYGSGLSWLVGVELIGASKDDATLRVRLSNYAYLEIAVGDARTRLIEIEDLGDDVAALRGRAAWYEYVGNTAESLRLRFRADALESGSGESVEDPVLPLPSSRGR